MITLYNWFYHPIPQANFWINRNCFRWKGIKEYLRFSIGAAFLEIAEWLGFEILSIIALKLGDNLYATFIILEELINLLYSFPLGFIITITIVVGELITRYNVKEVKKACFVLVFSAIGVVVTIMLFFFIFRNMIFRTFTKNPSLIDASKRPLMMMCVNEIFNCAQAATLSIFKGIGKQYYAAGFLFLSLFILMPTYTVILAYVVKWRLNGLFMGMGLGYFTGTTIYVVSLILVVELRKAQKDTIQRIKIDQAIIAKSIEEEAAEEEEQERQRKKPTVPRISHVVNSNVPKDSIEESTQIKNDSEKKL